MIVDRRVAGHMIWAGAITLPSSLRAQVATKTFSELLAQLSMDTPDNTAARSYKEIDGHAFVYGDEVAQGFSQPNKVKGSSDRDIGPSAKLLIITSEVSNKSVYIQKAYGTPLVPGVRSGVTIGFGYDIGQSSRSDFKSDWLGFLGEDDITLLQTACGKSGSSARELLPKYSNIDISWDTARIQFFTKTLPYFVRETEVAFENCSDLSADSFGALVDLVYNRGSASYIDSNTKDASDKDDRRREIRNIKVAMAQKNYSSIPNELVSMTRLWENAKGGKGVVLRRHAEAALFSAGLRK